MVASGAMEVVLMSRDARTRELMALTVRSIERRLGEPLRFRAAANGELAARAVLRDRPDIVIADEIASRMGAFALARSLRDDAAPYAGVIVIGILGFLLERVALRSLEIFTVQRWGMVREL